MIGLIKKSEYDQETPQLHTTNQPMAPRGRATEHWQPQDIRKSTNPQTKMIKIGD